MSSFSKHEFQDCVETQAFFFRCTEKEVVCFWPEEEDWFDDREVDEEDVSVLGALAGEEGDWIGAVGEAMADERETAACEGDCAGFGGREEVDGWEKEDEDKKDDGGEHWRDVGGEKGKQGNLVTQSTITRSRPEREPDATPSFPENVNSADVNRKLTIIRRLG